MRVAAVPVRPIKGAPMSPTKSTGKPIDIRPATGKLGILMPGMGAVATTFIAGVEAIRRGLVEAHRLAHADGDHPPRQAHRRPHRRSSRSSSRSPSSTTSCSAAGTSSPTTPTRRRARPACSKEHLDRAQGRPVDDQADDGGVRAGVRQEAHRDPRQEGQVEGGPRRAAHRGHQDVQEGQQLRPPGHGVVRLDRGLPQPGRRPRDAGGVREGPRRERSRDRAVADLRVRGAQVRRPLRERRAEPVGRHARAARARASRTACPSPARTSRPARR